jgi:hypothetical protein
MPPKLDRFLDEPLRAGHFTHFRAQGVDRNYHLAAHEPGQHTAPSKHQQVVGVPRTGYEPANTQRQQVTTSTEQEKDLAHIGDWTKERST